MGKKHLFCSQKLFKSKKVIHYSILHDIIRYQGLIRVLIYVTQSQKESLFQRARLQKRGVAAQAVDPLVTLATVTLCHQALLMIESLLMLCKGRWPIPIGRIGG